MSFFPFFFFNLVEVVEKLNWSLSNIFLKCYIVVVVGNWDVVVGSNGEFFCVCSLWSLDGRLLWDL